MEGARTGPSSAGTARRAAESRVAESRAAGSRARRWLGPVVIVAAVLLLYGRTLRYDFVNYDDYDLVVRNTEFLGDPANLLAAFATHAFASAREEGVYYRPALLLTYFIDYGLWGLDPSGYHLTNVLLHAGAALMFYALVLLMMGTARRATDRSGHATGTSDRAGRDSAEAGPTGATGSTAAARRPETIATFTALLFAVHPVQTESVAWIAGRNDVLLGLFLVSSAYCYVRQFEAGRTANRWFAASAALFGGALLTKESAIFFLPVFPLYELLLRRETPATLLSGANHLRVSVFAAIALAYLVLRFNLFGAFIGAEEMYGKIPLYNRFLMAPGLGMTSLLFLVWPSGLSIVHPIENVPWFEFPAILVAVAAGAVLVAVALVFRKRDPALSWATAWLLVGLVPLLNLFPLAVPILEHRLYAGSAGFAFAVSLVVWRAFGRGTPLRAGTDSRPGPAADSRPGPAAESARPGAAAADRAPAMLLAAADRVPAMILAAVCLVLASLAWIRIPVWAGSESLWLDAIAKAPESSRARFNLAGHYFEAREYAKAADQLEAYVTLKPEDMNGYAKLRQTYFLAGRIPEAAAVCRTMIARNPANPARYLEAGVLFERIGAGDSVVSVYEEGLRAVGGNIQLHRRLGMWWQAAGNQGKAEFHLRAADSLVRLEPPPGGGVRR